MRRALECAVRARATWSVSRCCYDANITRMSSRPKNVVAAMADLVHLFADHCPERTTLIELRQMFNERGPRQEAKGLFDRIRIKTLKAIKQENQLLVAQYSFEEACAKTLYNLGYNSAPFDADSPYRVVSSAFELARVLSIDELQIVRVISPPQRGTEI